MHPLTIANTKTKYKTTTKVKKKKSGAKIAAAVMTGGTSMVVTGGLKSNKTKRYIVWIAAMYLKRNNPLW